MGETLRNPPLVEAVCEFRFQPQSGWNLTVPGQVYATLAADFPEIRDVTTVESRTVREPGSIEALVEHQITPRVQMRRRDESALIQVGPDLLAINLLSPYPTWNDFRALITDVYSKYAETIPSSAIVRIGLRYINRIVISPGRTNISDYLTLDPPLHGALERPVTGFVQRYELAFDQPDGVLVHQTGFQTKPNSVPSLILDLDFAAERFEDLSDTDALAAWLTQAHDRVYESFVASVNPALLESWR